MKLISHRGNLNGRIPEKENHPDYILKTLALGYDVEVDVWSKNRQWYLGHDENSYEIKRIFLTTPGLWIHAKNSEALERLSLYPDEINYFWHQNDDYALTSKGYFWVYPGRYLFYHKSICVCPEIACGGDWIKCYGVCSDFIETYGK